MRFTDDTADIPDRLIALQEKGEVVFLCGAGISQRYDLPSFYALTANIYKRLGESWNGHPAEEEAMGLGPDGVQKGPAALDRALFAFAKRLRGQDMISRMRAERLLSRAIEEELQPPNAEFQAHADVWTLSRDPEMKHRIVTTNFDTLFERVAPAGTPSRSCPDLPPPLATDFTGILHLHGRISDETLGLSQTPLVLNSAEFGEAYLRSGWAARYVYDLARATTIVILGYGADDPPMRYILEVLVADRERFPDLREIFAFAPCKPDPARQARERAIWEAKGATAILYDSENPKDHDNLYRTISAWAAFARDPTGWRREHARRILSEHPDTIGEADWERFRWLLAGGDAGELLGEINPGPEWGAAIGKAEIFSKGEASPFRWMLERLNDPAMPEAVAEHLPLSAVTLSALERALTWRNRKSKDLEPALLQAWQLILKVANRRASGASNIGLRWSRTAAAIEDGDHSFATKQEILDCLQPRAQIGRVFRFPGLEPEPDGPPKLRDVLRVDWGPDNFDDVSILIQKWPAEKRRDLVRSLTSRLNDALEEATDTGTLYAASGDVRSVSVHPQDRRQSGFYPIVRAIVDLWDADAERHPDEAKREALNWLASPYLLYRRMGLHALRKPFFDSREIADALLALSDEEFWLTDARREVMQVFVHKWGDLDQVARERVEGRVVEGMPRELLVPDGPDGPDEQIRIVRDNAKFIRLACIVGAGHVLGARASEALAALKAEHPDWASAGEQDEFRVWSYSARDIEGPADIAVLQDVEPEEILTRVEEVASHDPFAEGDIWRLYCDAEPASALEALLASDPTGTVKPGAWRSFLWSITASEGESVHQAAFDAVSRDTFALTEPYAVLDWVQRKRTHLDISVDQFLSLWDKAFKGLRAEAKPVEDQSRNDVVFSMLNSAEGKIGTILLEEYSRVREGDFEAERTALTTRMERLARAEGELGFLGAAALFDGLRALFHDREQWTTEILIPLTRWTSPQALAAWSSLLRGHVVLPKLYAALKPQLLEAGQHSELDRVLDNIAPWLIAPLLWAQAPQSLVPDITAVEVRLALSQAVETVRSRAAYWLTTALTEIPGGPAVVWRDRIGPLLEQIWPLDPRCRSHGASVQLIRLALATGDAFEDAVRVIAPALGPIDPWEVETWLDRHDDAEPHYARAPASVLALLNAVIQETAIPGALLAMLQRLVDSDPALSEDPRYLKLLGWARRWAAP